MATNTFPLANFTEMAKLVDADAVNGYLASGMIVIVETDKNGFIAGIVSAHTNRTQARTAHIETQDDDGAAIIFPTEHGPYIFYGPLADEDFNEFCRL